MATMMVGDSFKAILTSQLLYLYICFNKHQSVFMIILHVIIFVDVFYIYPISGNISAVGIIDRENIASYVLTVMVCIIEIRNNMDPRYAPIMQLRICIMCNAFWIILHYMYAIKAAIAVSEKKFGCFHISRLFFNIFIHLWPSCWTSSV